MRHLCLFQNVQVHLAIMLLLLSALHKQACICHMRGDFLVAKQRDTCQGTMGAERVM